jgi:hypothetical protein
MDASTTAALERLIAAAKAHPLYGLLLTEPVEDLIRDVARVGLTRRQAEQVRRAVDTPVERMRVVEGIRTSGVSQEDALALLNWIAGDVRRALADGTAPVASDVPTLALDTSHRREVTNRRASMLIHERGLRIVYFYEWRHSEGRDHGTLEVTVGGETKTHRLNKENADGPETIADGCWVGDWYYPSVENGRAIRIHVTGRLEILKTKNELSAATVEIGGRPIAAEDPQDGGPLRLKDLLTGKTLTTLHRGRGIPVKALLVGTWCVVAIADGAENGICWQDLHGDDHHFVRCQPGDMALGHDANLDYVVVGTRDGKLISMTAGAVLTAMNTYAGKCTHLLKAAWGYQVSVEDSRAADGRGTDALLICKPNGTLVQQLDMPGSNARTGGALFGMYSTVDQVVHEDDGAAVVYPLLRRGAA